MQRWKSFQYNLISIIWLVIGMLLKVSTVSLNELESSNSKILVVLIQYRRRGPPLHTQSFLHEQLISRCLLWELTFAACESFIVASKDPLYLLWISSSASVCRRQIWLGLASLGPLAMSISIWCLSPRPWVWLYHGLIFCSKLLSSSLSDLGIVCLVSYSSSLMLELYCFQNWEYDVEPILTTSRNICDSP